MDEDKIEKPTVIEPTISAPSSSSSTNGNESQKTLQHASVNAPIDNSTKPQKPERRNFVNKRKSNKDAKAANNLDDCNKDNLVVDMPPPSSSVRMVDMKQRINRVKDKLAKQSRKCDEPEARRERYDSGEFSKRDRKPRSQSERESQRDSSTTTTSVRSMSFTMSSTSTSAKNRNLATGKIPPKAVEPSSSGTAGGHMRPDKSKRVRGSRGKKKSTSEGTAAYGFGTTRLDDEDFILDSEAFLLLDLLFMEPRKREAFIIESAKRKGLLIAEKSSSFYLNPRLLKWNEPPFRLPFREKAESLGIAVDQTAVIQKTTIFEDYVNDVVRHDLPDEQQKNFEFPRTPKRQRTKNYFKSDEFENGLEAYAQKLVAANLGVIVEEELRISAKNNDHGFIKVKDCDRDAMFSSQWVRKFAMHGDLVRAFVRIETQSQQATTGEKETKSEQAATEPVIDNDQIDTVVEEEPALADRLSKAFIIKVVKPVENRRVVGNFLSYRKNSKFITFVPRDMRAPNIRIFQENWPESFKTGDLQNVSDMLYIAEIIEWQNEICLGKIIAPIGKCGELDSENRAILLQNNLKFDPYDEKFNAMFEGDFPIDEEELKRREDLRTECIFTIDPLTARDLDDAMSCRQLADGNFEIGVHISDVSFFIDEESELDRIVKTRTTSVYMVNEVFHMLPKPLCMRCSLLPGEDKLAFSVFWRISPAAEVLSTRFARTVIRSCTQFAYQHAQQIIDNPDKEFGETDFPQIHNGYGPSDVVRCVRQLHELATIMRNKRFDNGALKIDKPKIYFDLDPETGAPIGYRQQELSTANFLIEEFMLLANQSVADFIYSRFPSISILRNHEAPFKHMMKRVREQLQKSGMSVDISSSKTVYSSLQRLIAESRNPTSMAVALSQLVSKPMMRARYFCSDSVDYDRFWHYALSIPVYTHFTSPIRRYPDVLVHRVLAAALDYSAAPQRTPDELQKLAEACNDGKYSAKLAGDDSTNLYFFHYIRTKGPLVLLAVVTEVYSYSFEAILIDTGHVISVSFKDCKDAVLEVSKESTSTRAKVVFPSCPDQKPFELRTCSEVWLAVTAKSKRLKGQIVPRPSPDGKVILPKDVANEASDDDEAEKPEMKEREEKEDVNSGGEVQTTLTIRTVEASAPLVSISTVETAISIVRATETNESSEEHQSDEIRSEEAETVAIAKLST